MFTGLGRSQAALRGPRCPLAPQQGRGGEDPAPLGGGPNPPPSAAQQGARMAPGPSWKVFFCSSPRCFYRRRGGSVAGGEPGPATSSVRPAGGAAASTSPPSPRRALKALCSPPLGASFLRAPRPEPRGVFGRWGGQDPAVSSCPLGLLPSRGGARCHPSSGWAPPGAWRCSSPSHPSSTPCPRGAIP